VNDKKLHQCRPQPNMCLHVAHHMEAADYWEVQEIADRPAHYYGD
jgi:hypothetical protein